MLPNYFNPGISLYFNLTEPLRMMTHSLCDILTWARPKAIQKVGGITWHVRVSSRHLHNFQSRISFRTVPWATHDTKCLMSWSIEVKCRNDAAYLPPSTFPWTFHQPLRFAISRTIPSFHRSHLSVSPCVSQFIVTPTSINQVYRCL